MKIKTLSNGVVVVEKQLKHAKRYEVVLPTEENLKKSLHKLSKNYFKNKIL